jgi:hypothetical protein
VDGPSGLEIDPEGRFRALRPLVLALRPSGDHC